MNFPWQWGTLRKDADEGEDGGGADDFFDAPRGKDKPEDDADRDKGKGSKESKGKDEDEVARLRKENEALRRRTTELEVSERMWAQRAGARGDDDDEAESDDEPEADDPAAEDEDDPAQLLEDLTKGGIKALQKRGVLTQKQIVQLVRTEAAKLVAQGIGHAEKRLASDAALIREFPELEDAKSPLFERTSAILKDMVKRDASLRSSPAALALAARTAKAELKAEGKIRDRGLEGRGREDEDDDLDRSERLRRERVRSQQGPRGGGGGMLDDDYGEDVGPQTREIMAAMRISDSKEQKRVLEDIAKARRNGTRRAG